MRAWNTWERVLLALLALLLLVFGFAQPGFMTPDALADSTFNFSEKGILALALALLWMAMPETLAKPSFAGHTTVA